MATPAELGDPADWSIDQVIDRLCHTTTSSWITNAKLKPLNNVQTVEQAFRDNDIDGDTLLVLEDSNLRDDIGVTSFGQRRALLGIIRYLRSISSGWQNLLPQTQNPPQPGVVASQPITPHGLPPQSSDHHAPPSNGFVAGDTRPSMTPNTASRILTQLSTTTAPTHPRLPGQTPNAPELHTSDIVRRTMGRSDDAGPSLLDVVDFSLENELCANPALETSTLR